jgi:geranylgeranyl pyrophosphate synthase
MNPSLLPELPATDDAWSASALRQVESCRRELLGRSQVLRESADYQCESTGKRLRPLILLCFSCLGQTHPRPKPAAVRAAAAVELLHEASLIHDDVLDRSLVRRGRPSIPERFGVSTASHLGAFTVSMSLSVLAEVCEAEGAALDLDLLRVLSQAQLEESLGPPRGAAARWRRCLRVIQGKTGALFQLSAQMGAALCPGSAWRDAVVRAAAPFAERLALPFQLRDDLGDLENDSLLRKPGGGDLLRGLPTLAFQIWAASLPDPEAAWERLPRCRDDRAAAEVLRQEILRSEVRREIRETIRTELRAAQAVLQPLPEGAARRTLEALVGQLGS